MSATLNRSTSSLLRSGLSFGFFIFLSACFCGAILLAAQTAIAEDYKPMFSQKMLNGLDPETRARFAALERENQRRWRNRNPSAPDVDAAKRHHQDTQAMLRRFEESRNLENSAGARQNASTAEQKRKCDVVAAEIKELSSGGVFYENGPDGERRYLSDKELAARVKSQKKSYNKHCKK